MLHIETISTIIPAREETWKSHIFLSFDVDWAHDYVIYDCYDLVRSFGVSTTWFITHQTGVIKTFARDEFIEMGIHPNFNDLLTGNSKRTHSEVLRNSLDIVPGALCVRSHSLTQSERLLDVFLEFGLSHISNFFIPFSSGVKIRPFNLWDNSVIVPHNWQDNVSLKMGYESPIQIAMTEGFHVFNFHPIHVFLNTESLDRYESTRRFHQDPEELIKWRYSGYGIRSQLTELLEFMCHE